ncbi:uncharacterized protein LOC126980859 [Eriocheir sinensis]|uniref:uncharacterized protein LOC126980859 n=1 Tax=Eriocheir sinensis TaxID=95602 RepID=UPI0021C5A244|nr:uncharacterized protein LOC126980859 [Eriocheir sinensis]
MALPRPLTALLLLLACALASAQGSSCPEPFSLMGSRCVFVTHNSDASGSPAVSWFEARMLCAEKVDGTSWTADLVSNYNASFQRLLTKHIKAYPDVERYHNYHVGAAFVKDAWLWLDDTPINKMDYIWHIFSPPTGLGGFTTAGVSFIMPNQRLVLAPSSYSKSQHYVCEAKPAAA